MTKVRTRYAPSPTGVLHIGGVRTALFNFLFAKNNNGDFLLRIEDTDRKRFIADSLTQIKKSLEALSLKWDQYAVQSQRLKIYDKYLSQLKKKGLVYQDDGAWRFKVEKGKKLQWLDGVHGRIQFSSDVIEDFVIVKSDKFPTYHFANVIDDTLMQISHVLRGDEWLSSTPKHLMLYRALGWQPPVFIHVPVILGPDHKKLSKRQGAKSVLDYVGDGYLKEAIINFLALLGWAPKDNREIFSLDELIKEFSIDHLNKNSPIFNLEKLEWFNGQWIRKLSDDNLSREIAKRFPDYDLKKIKMLSPLVKDRLKTILDFKLIADGFFNIPNPSKIPSLLIDEKTITSLIKNYDNLNSGDWYKIKIDAATAKVMQSENVAKPEMFRSIGIATLGSVVTPPLMESLEILGRAETLKRLKNAAKKAK